MGLIETGTSLFSSRFGEEKKPLLFFCPGRINLIGEHIDYNGGPVLPAAISRGIYAFCGKRNDSIVRMSSADLPGTHSVNFSENIIFERDRGWANYPAGVISALAEKENSLCGADILFAGNLPEGSGLSSSAAMEVLTAFLMMNLAGKENPDRIELALLCRAVENEFIGVNCGIMDQFAVAMGRKDNAIYLNTSTLEYEYIPVRISGYVFIIMNSNKKRELAASAYNRRLAECMQCLDIINTVRNISNLCMAESRDLELIKDSVLKKRAAHVISENSRVTRSLRFLREGDIEGFGDCLNQSHASLRTDYEVSGFELDSLVEAADKHPACAGARMTGAGFGGCAIALIREDAEKDFIDSVSKEYLRKTGINGEFFRAGISDGVERLST